MCMEIPAPEISCCDIDPYYGSKEYADKRVRDLSVYLEEVLTSDRDSKRKEDIAKSTIELIVHFGLRNSTAFEWMIIPSRIASIFISVYSRIAMEVPKKYKTVIVAGIEVPLPMECVILERGREVSNHRDVIEVIKHIENVTPPLEHSISMRKIKPKYFIPRNIKRL